MVWRKVCKQLATQACSCTPAPNPDSTATAGSPAACPLCQQECPDGGAGVCGAAHAHLLPQPAGGGGRTRHKGKGTAGLVVEPSVWLVGLVWCWRHRVMMLAPMPGCPADATSSDVLSLGTRMRGLLLCGSNQMLKFACPALPCIALLAWFARTWRCCCRSGSHPAIGIRPGCLIISLSPVCCRCGPMGSSFLFPSTA